MARKAIRTYETVVAFNPELTEDKLGELNRKLVDIINSSGGVAGPVKVWGKFRLAYRIKKFNHAYYTHILYSGSGDTVAELERNLRIWDEVLRHLTINILNKPLTVEELAKLSQESITPSPEDIITSELDEFSEVGVYTTGKPRATMAEEESEEEWQSGDETEEGQEQ